MLKRAVFFITVASFVICSNISADPILRLGVEAGAMFNYFTLPRGQSDITKGYGSSPNNPMGITAMPAISTTLKTGGMRLGYMFALPLTIDTFRGNNFQREGVHFPGWGETYTYSQVVGMRYQAISLGWLNHQGDEYGGRFGWMRVSVEQGLDAWDRRNPEQSMHGNGLLASLYLKRQSGLMIELGPFGPLDFGADGKGSIIGATVGYDHTF